MEFPINKKIILFDGVCNYCNDIVNTIITRDTNDKYRFATLQSDKGREIIKYIGLNPNIDSIVLYEPGVAYYIKSEAILKIADDLGGKFTLLKAGFLLPNGIRNLGYDYFAKNRYKWFGKEESCMVPTAEVKAKFLE